MNSKFIAVLLLIILCCKEALRAQSDVDRAVESVIESIADRVAEDFDYSELTERLIFYQKHPVNINKTNAEQLSEFIFLTPIQINALLNHIQNNGEILELSELQSIEAFDLETLRRLTPFITTGVPNSVKELITGNTSVTGNHDLMLRFGQVLESQQGYIVPDTSLQNRYLGSPARVLLRYRYKYGQNFSVSVNMDKDAGEQFMRGKQIRGFDFYSGNIFFKNAGRFLKIAIGDYSLQFGQGLSLWSGLGIGRGAEVASAAKQDMGLRPYTSTNEALFFRGASVTVKLGKLLYTPFISFKNIDGNLSLSPENSVEITALGTSGLHRTKAEHADKNSVSQLVFGNALQFDGKNLDIGITAYHTRFNHAFEKGRFLYNQFDFAGKKLSNAGINYNYTHKNSYFFGEAAHSFGSGFALINGVLTSLSPKVSSVFMYRHYSRNYHSFYNQAFSEGTAAVNEKGFYSGLVIKPLSKVELATYFDVFSFPWMKFRADAPSKGYELSSQLVYMYSKTFRVAARYRFQLKEENGVNETVNVLQNVERQTFRIDLSYKIGESFTLRNRVEASYHKKGNSGTGKGYMVYQDLICNPMQTRLSGNLRFAIFDTPGFDTRIYAFENDLLYSYSSPAYQDSGLRYYINTRYTLRKGLDLWLKYSVTDYTDLTEIGSGLDRIAGSKKSEIKMQLRYQF